MEQKNRERCMGCMEFKSWDGQCSCGFRLDRYKREAHSLLPGTRLKNGDYRIGRVLGEGGFGITYIGFDENLQSKVAIKEFFPTGYVMRNVDKNGPAVEINDKEIYARGLEAFVREAQTLAQFSGLDGIVNVRTLFQENNTAYLVMEYVDGISAKRYVEKNGPIPPDQVLRMLKQPIQALFKIHEKHLIHRDVSADNILIRPDGKATLIDFGAARTSNMLDERTRTIICKNGFSALEQYSKEGRQGPWTDVYSMCATIYYMLTGVLPPNSTERIMDDQIRPLEAGNKPGLSKEICQGIMKGMSVRYTERLQNMEQLSEALYGEKLSSGNSSDFASGSNGGDQKKESSQSRTFLKRKQEMYKKMTPTGMLGELDQLSAAREREKKRKKIRTAVAAAITIALVFAGIVIYQFTGTQYTGKENDSADRQAAVTQMPVPQEDQEHIEKSKETSAVVSEPPATKKPSQKSSGDNSKTAKMPDLYGMTRKAAVKRLLSRNIRYVLIYKHTTEMKKGRVYRTSVHAGKKVNAKKEVNIYISNGAPAATPEPTMKPEAASVPKSTAVPKKKAAKPKKTPKSKYAGNLDSFLY